MDEPKRKASPARIAANERWEAKAYDKILVRLPKGTKERIQVVSPSVNGFIKQAVLQSLTEAETDSKKEIP